MVACSASPRRPKSAPSASWNGLWRKRKGNGRMSRRVGLDHATVVEAAAKLVDEEGIEQLCRGLHDGCVRSEEHTSELQSPDHLLCRLLLEKKKIQHTRKWRPPERGRLGMDGEGGEELEMQSISSAPGTYWRDRELHCHGQMYWYADGRVPV